MRLHPRAAVATDCGTCTACPAARPEDLARLGIATDDCDHVVGLAGNPNVGKSTVFNALTGLRQHTGNWPGKTVTRAEGSFTREDRRFKLVDLPGTYSLEALTQDEAIARDFIVNARPDVLVVVVDASHLERNLHFVLQVLAVTPKVVVCLNLVDEARRHHREVDAAVLAEELGVPVVPTVARSGDGMDELTATVARVARDAAPFRDAADSEPAHVADEAERERLTAASYARAERIAARAVVGEGGALATALDRRLDAVVTHRWLGVPIMLALLTGVFWLTIAGANVPSGLLATLLIDTVHPWLHGLAAAASLPTWLAGFLLDGVYLATAWVVAVMLPPMAIFFPLFTLLEDSGYLARVAFNLDGLFQRAGAHGKQALTMCMGFGCNAAGVIACRVIDSRRERLIAIITNNFSLCNGRWPTQILIATIFIGALVPAHLASLAAAATVVGVALLGIALTFAVSWGLSRRVLRGEPSHFSLELPPYRPPRFWQTLYTSFIDRTVFVLWRAVLFAAPAGAAVWLLSNVTIGGASLAAHLVGGLDPVAALIGLNGVILVAYILAVPANEIVIPTLLMLTVMTAGLSGVGEGAGVMFELDSIEDTAAILRAGGWTLLTAVNLLLFSLVHNPCSTTIFTIWKETGSARWTALAALLPLGMGIALCGLVALVWRMVGA